MATIDITMVTTMATTMPMDTMDTTGATTMVITMHLATMDTTMAILMATTMVMVTTTVIPTMATEKLLTMLGLVMAMQGIRSGKSLISF